MNMRILSGDQSIPRNVQRFVPGVSYIKEKKETGKNVLEVRGGGG
jgi:hypothetical protein